MQNENNDNQIKKVQDALQNSPNMQSEEQLKQSQISEDSPAQTENHKSSQNTGSDEKTVDVEAAFDDFLKKFEPHQQRVIVEARDLAIKANDLRVFISSNQIFQGLYAEEKEALQIQLFHMERYLEILNARIKVWQGDKWNQSYGKTLIGDFGTGQEPVFILKYLAALYIDVTNVFGRDGRRNSIVATEMEKTQMMAVKSFFSKQV